MYLYSFFYFLNESSIYKDFQTFNHWYEITSDDQWVSHAKNTIRCCFNQYIWQSCYSWELDENCLTLHVREQRGYSCTEFYKSGIHARTSIDLTRKIFVGWYLVPHIIAQPRTQMSWCLNIQIFLMFIIRFTFCWGF